MTGSGGPVNFADAKKRSGRTKHARHYDACRESVEVLTGEIRLSGEVYEKISEIGNVIDGCLELRSDFEPFFVRSLHLRARKNAAQMLRCGVNPSVKHPLKRAAIVQLRPYSDGTASLSPNLGYLHDKPVLLSLSPDSANRGDTGAPFLISHLTNF